MTEEKITLDKEVFKTLASGTRVDIIKSLDKRRKTLSELSKQLGMSVSTVKEHLDNLVSVGLIVQIDDGHKWKYYELTKKGQDILHPEEKNIWIILGISALGIAVVGFDLLRNMFASTVTFGLGATRSASEMVAENADKIAEAPMASGEAAQTFAQALPQLPYVHIGLFVVFGLILAVTLIYMIRRRNRIKV